MAEESEIIQLEQEIIRLRKLVYYDELTGLLNRRGFIEAAEKLFQSILIRRSDNRRNTSHIPFSIIFLDVDNFKKVNDTHGHEAGDIVLQYVGAAIKHRLRAGDIYARWGGEEFVALLLGADIANGQRVAETLRETIEQLKIPINKGSIEVTISLGIMDYNNEETLHDMLAKADAAMYGAKQKGKNRVEVFIR